jgi:hypothetical protein
VPRHAASWRGIAREHCRAFVTASAPPSSDEESNRSDSTRRPVRKRILTERRDAAPVTASTTESARAKNKLRPAILHRGRKKVRSQPQPEGAANRSPSGTVLIMDHANRGHTEVNPHVACILHLPLECTHRSGCNSTSTSEFSIVQSSWFPTCLTCWSRSQPGLCLCTRPLISKQSEPSFPEITSSFA